MDVATDDSRISRNALVIRDSGPGPVVFRGQRGDAALMAPAYTPLRDVWMGWYGNLDFQEETADAFITPVRPNGWYDGGTYIRLHEHRWDAGQGQPSSSGS